MSSAASSGHSAEQPAAQWRISASRDQVEVPKHKQTHTRPLQLPFTIDAWILGEYYKRRQYLGHGKSKVCYGLTDTLVLKLCKEKDQEPELFQELQASGVYPVVHASGQCRVEDHEGPRLETWHAWVVDQAKPLDQILKENPAASNVCIPGAVRAMLIAHFNNHVLSDNALFNFGMMNNKVVIVNAGSRFGHRASFNRKVMVPFWIKAQTVIHPAAPDVYRQEWRVAGEDMVTALQTYETRWQELRGIEVLCQC